MTKLTKKQIDLLKESIDEIGKSDEQFIFMIFKKDNGEDNITHHAHNIPIEKVKWYLKRAADSGRIINGKG